MRRYKPPTQKQLDLACEIWNAKFPVGTEVTVEVGSGEILATRTRSLAMLAGNSFAGTRSVVIFLEGMAGSCPLSRVRAKGEVAHG